MKNIKKILLIILLALPWLASANTHQPVYSFGIVPQQTPSQLLHAWAPVLRYLEQETGARFVFRTAPDIPTFEQRTAAGEYDFAYMNPYHFTVFNQGEQGYQAVARARDSTLQGIVVVRKDSPIQQLNELDGATLAFPAPAAFAASILPQAHFRAQHIAFTPRYVSSHDSVYQAVAAGLFPAGGGVERTFMATDASVREQLRILWTTPGHTPHAIAAREGLNAALVQQVQRALVTLEQNADAATALDRLKIKGFTAAQNADWNDVRALNINLSLGATE
ncbi:phosphate/phosphite/phosphonate ABC transporter substrate-binding protein [Oceanimonas marisflavi]|uniref:phosphate/phosphite/phosphonate ABC transporter substrate-binding protein n=1 Tax=Oceanimonas marisflavi TaxID=2059724 RepID=UPI000D315993|nr:phosphate/phosphite/phosphonate ABC transporter substrate-binding protein [Oceanimonas marisflavi]